MEKVIINRVPGKSPFTLPQRPVHMPLMPQEEVPYKWHKDRSKLKVACSTGNYQIVVMNV